MRRPKKDLKPFKKQEQSIYRILVGSLCFGIANWLFWHQQFLERDYRYMLVFVALPIGIGIVLLKKYFKSYVAYYLDTKSKLEKTGVVLFLLVGGAMISFGSLGTLADILFKSAFSWTADPQTTTNKYPITRFVAGLSHGLNSINRFSRIDYLENGKEQSINSENPTVNNRLKDLPATAIRSKTLVLETRAGFWGIKRVENFQIE
ncbi:hypothetical protein [Flavobacterium sp.]|uniref:hypothetical protein n=1 Tax=Flavobacterium sp. TaxID=239 RepID=UPI0039E5B028